MEEIDLKELFSMFWEKRLIILAIIAVCTIIGIIYTLGFVTPEYTSSTTLVLVQGDEITDTSGDTTENTTSITTSDVTLNSQLVSTYSELIKSKSIIREVISNLGISELEEDEVRKNITVSAVEDTEVIEITVTDENAEYASRIANEIASVFTERVAEIYNINNVYIIDEAEVSEEPSNINHVKDILIFMVVGIVVAAAYVIIISLLDTTVKTSEDIEKGTGLTVLASIPVYDFEENVKVKGETNDEERNNRIHRF